MGAQIQHDKAAAQADEAGMVRGATSPENYVDSEASAGEDMAQSGAGESADQAAPPAESRRWKMEGTLVPNEELPQHLQDFIKKREEAGAKVHVGEQFAIPSSTVEHSKETTTASPEIKQVFGAEGPTEDERKAIEDAGLACHAPPQRSDR